MPEGPECYVVAWRLGHHLENKQLTAIQIHHGRYLKPREAELSNIAAFNAHLADHGPIRTVECKSKGKLVYSKFDNGWAMLSTMGLSGSWVTRHTNHCGISLTFHEAPSIWFRDQLHYGTIKLVSHADLDKKLASLGPDVLDTTESGWTPERWLTLCKRKGCWSLPKLLMDQSLISGVGNYLKTESLYAARVSPLVLIRECSEADLLEVLRAVLDVSRRCVGWKAHQARIPGWPRPTPFVMQVYNKKLDPQRNPVVRQKTTDGRVTHWVPAVQTRPGPPQPYPPASDV